MNKLYLYARYILSEWINSGSSNEWFRDRYHVSFEEMVEMDLVLDDIIEKVFEEKEFKRIMRLIKKDMEECE